MALAIRLNMEQLIIFHLLIEEDVSPRGKI
jgi:hypothetical protein